MDTPRRRRRWWWRIPVVFACLCCLTGILDASAGDADPIYRSCVEKCETSGCVGDNCFQHCKFSSDGKPMDGLWYLQEPLYLKWKQWDCRSCHYHCMVTREEQRQKLGGQPVKYHGKWPFFRVYGMQEPVSVAFSVLNLSMQFHGWISFFILVYYKLPLRSNRTIHWSVAHLRYFGYEFMLLECWFPQDVECTEKLDYSFMVALIGFSLILAVLRTLNVRDEAARVMCAAPVITFVVTHISYLNFYNLDYGWNTKVCVTMTVIQLLIRAIWASVTSHPSRWKLRAVVIGRLLSMLLKVYDFPPYLGYVDAHALWHATTFPLTHLWLSFVRDDAEFRISLLVKKVKYSVKATIGWVFYSMFFFGLQIVPKKGLPLSKGMFFLHQWMMTDWLLKHLVGGVFVFPFVRMADEFPKWLVGFPFLLKSVLSCEDIHVCKFPFSVLLDIVF